MLEGGVFENVKTFKFNDLLRPRQFHTPKGGMLYTRLRPYGTLAFMEKAMRKLLLIGLVLSAIAYMASSRTIEVLTETIFPISLFLNVTLLAFFAIRFGMFGRPKISIHLLLLPLYTGVLSVIEAVVIYSAWAVVSDAYLWIHSLSPPRFLYVTLVGFFLLCVGMSLFFFRLKARFFFGLSEALSGFCIGIWKIPASADPITWNLDVVFVMVTASIFLIVRGFDNMHAGLSSNPDAILKAFHESEYGRFLKLTVKSNEQG